MSFEFITTQLKLFFHIQNIIWFQSHSSIINAFDIQKTKESTGQHLIKCVYLNGYKSQWKDTLPEVKNHVCHFLLQKLQKQMEIVLFSEN